MTRSIVASALALGLCLLIDCGGSSPAAVDTHDTDAGRSPVKMPTTPGNAVDAGASPKDAGPAFDAGSSPARNQAMPGHLCERLSEIQCAGEAFCCTMPGRDVVSCRQSLQQGCNDSLALDSIANDPAVGFDAKATSEALAELEHRASLCDPSVAAWAVSGEGFGGSFTGTRGKGDDCQPVGGLLAARADLAAALASCRPGDGLACLPGPLVWTCAERAARAGRCFTDLNCAGGLYCDNPSSGLDGVCRELKAPGEVCAAADQCSSFLCRAGSCVAGSDVQAAYCLE